MVYKDSFYLDKKDLLNPDIFIELDLQFFAKDGPGGEKTEAATPKKLQDARKEGQVAKSKELGNSASLFALFLALKIFAGTVGIEFLEVFNFTYSRIPDFTKIINGDISSWDYSVFIRTIMLRILIIVLPFFAFAVVLCFVIDYIQVGWAPTSKPLAPKLSKLNPISGFKKIISAEKIKELILSIVKIALIGYMAYSTLVDKFHILYSFHDFETITSIKTIGEIVTDMGLKICIVYLVVAIADYAYQKWKFSEDMKMTKQEVKDEFKNSEGDPQIKGKQKQRMMEASRRRMMQSVPSADVVITNPTHFAVALKYDPDRYEAPFVVAKGEDFLAARIKETAKENKIDIVENKGLARALYYNVDLGQMIPPELYHTVADILAVIWNARNKGA